MSDRPTPETDDIARGNHVVPAEWAKQLERERDEAREELKHIDEYGTEEINAAVELRQKLAQALVERDEAREELNNIRINLGDDAEGYTLLHAVCVMQNERDEVREKLSAAWQSLRDSQDEVLRLTFENRELRKIHNE